VEYYWELILRDGTKYEIPPAAVGTVNKRMGSKEPIFINTATIPFAQVEHFRQTDKVFGQPLLDAVAQAFKEPVITDNGIQARWVKKRVTQRDFNKKFAALPAYRKLEEGNGMVTIAFRLATHDINVNTVDYCTDEEALTLTQS
jgi:hypothetical protein